MVMGIGMDCTQIQRIEKSLQKNSFMEKVFSAQEKEMLLEYTGKRKLELAAGCFTAKEAFLKAAGVGLGGFALAEIGLLREPSGKPYFALLGQAEEYCVKQNITPYVSITHENGMVMAFVVFEQK